VMEEANWPGWMVINSVDGWYFEGVNSMMYPLFDELIEEMRRKERMAYAEEMRQLARISPRKSSRSLWFAALMAGLGSWLVSVGCRLQMRYRTLNASSLVVYTSTKRPNPNCTS
jgi:hypothetical protein